MRLGKRKNAQFVCVLKGEREREIPENNGRKLASFEQARGQRKKEKIGVEINRKCVL